MAPWLEYQQRLARKQQDERLAATAPGIHPYDRLDALPAVADGQD